MRTGRNWWLLALILAMGSFANRSFADPPRAEDDWAETTMNTPVDFDVLGNDSDPEWDPMTVVGFTQPYNGVVTDNGNGSFNYVPNEGFQGDDYFIYWVTDGVDGTAQAYVWITVVPGNNNPPGSSEDWYEIPANQVLSIPAPGVLENDWDDEGDPLQAALAYRPRHGQVDLAADGSFVYRPETNYNGNDAFYYCPWDGISIGDVTRVRVVVGENTEPVGQADQYTVNAGQTLSVPAPGVLANDTDANGDILIAFPGDYPSHGNLEFYNDGAFNYTPEDGYQGSDSFSYYPFDGTAAPMDATLVTLTISSGNTPPAGQADQYQVNQDQVLTVAAPGVLGNDTDPDGNALSAVLAAGPSHGSLTLNADGSFTYTPAAGYKGSDGFSYYPSDGVANGDATQVTISILAVNHPPSGQPDQYEVNEDQALNVAAPGVLGNDADPDGNALSAVLAAGPSHGTLALNANGSFTYNPAANYHGADGFTYNVSDGVLSSGPIQVTLAVKPVNDPPAGQADQYEINEDQTLNVAAPGVLGNDADIDGDALSAVLATGPTHGTLALNANGSFTYTPAANYNGSDGFTYTPRDGAVNGAAVQVTLVIKPVNDSPAGQPDQYQVNEDQALNVAAPGVLGNDSDIEGNSLSAALAAGPSHGTLTLNANGSFTYTPAANYHGADGFTYNISDGILSSGPIQVTLIVKPVNDPPAGQVDQYDANEDQALNVAAPGVLGNDADIDGDALSAILKSGPIHGTLALNADGSFAYTPAGNYNGGDGFTYAPSDGTVEGAAVQVTINIKPVNDMATGQADQYEVNEDQALNVAAPGVLGNDADIDGDALSAILKTGPSHGTLTLNADGSFAYTPAGNYNGGDGFTYVPSDGVAEGAAVQVTINVKPVNDTPTGQADQFAVDEDQTLTVPAPGVLGNDADPDGDALSAVLKTGPIHGTLTLNADGSFTYTPAGNYNGGDGFTYAPSDGVAEGAPVQVTINIKPVNDVPTGQADPFAVDEDQTLTVPAPGVLGNDADIDGDALSAILKTSPSHGTLALNADGSFAYTPAANYNGGDGFTYAPSDGVAEGAAVQVTLTIKPVNDTPTGQADQYEVNEDQALNVAAPGVLGNDADLDGDALSAILKTGPSHGTLTLNADGSFSYTPAANYNGGDGFTYAPSDGTVEGAAVQVTINVKPVNDTPTGQADQFAVDEDQTLTVPAPGVLGNDADPDGDALSAILKTGPSHGTLTLNADGSFSYTPAANYNGGDGFSYAPSDGTVEGAAVQVTINVKPVNDTPTGQADPFAVDEDQTLTVPAPGVLGNDADIDGDALSATLKTGPIHGTLTLNADGSFAYTPAGNYNGGDGFTYAPSDGTAEGAPVQVTINIKPVNDTPTGQADQFAVDEDQTLTTPAPGVLGNDADIDGDALSAILKTGPVHGTLTLNADGSFAYTPAANYNGGDGFTYAPSDGTAEGAAVQVTINIKPVNDTPTGQADLYEVNEDQALNVAAPGVLGNDADIDGDALSAILKTGPSHGTLALNADGSFSYTPAGNYNGGDGFTYAPSDGTVEGAAIQVTINIKPVNDTATGQADQYNVDEDQTLTVPAPGVLGNDTDIDGDALSVVLKTGPSHGTLALNADGSFAYTPAANYNGGDGFTYAPSDGIAEGAAVQVTINIKPVNDTATGQADQYNVDEDQTLTVPAPGVLGNDADLDGDALSAILKTGPSHGTLTLNADGSFSYTPAANYNGSDGFTYVPSDGTVEGAAVQVTLTIKPVNDTPEGQADQYEVNEDHALDIAASGVLGNDEDDDGDDLQAFVVAGPSHGTLDLKSDGSFKYTPEDNYHGEDSFTYYPSDGKLHDEPVKVTLTVKSVNDPPVVGDITASRPISVTQTLQASAAFTDPDTGDTHTAQWTWGDGTNSAGTVNGSQVTGSHRYTKPGLYDIRLTVTDQAGASDESYFRAIVFDPAGSSVTCGGWIYESKIAQVSFRSRYQPKELTPSGEVKFDIKNVGHFEAVSQSWLVVDGSRFIFQGTGTLNDAGNYGFLVSGSDGGVKKPDYVRIKVWNLGTGAVVFDTQPGADDAAAATVLLVGGSIVVH